MNKLNRDRDFGLIETLTSGAMAGAIAANTMTLIRMAARRRKLIQKTVPQMVEERLVEKLPALSPKTHLGHHALDQVLHVGYGAMLGAIDGLLLNRWGRPTLRRGLLHGLATWISGSFILLPALGATKPPWKSDLAENSVNLMAHLLFGFGNALITEELLYEIEHQPTDLEQRYATRTG